LWVVGLGLWDGGDCVCGGVGGGLRVVRGCVVGVLVGVWTLGLGLLDVIVVIGFSGFVVWTNSRIVVLWVWFSWGGVVGPVGLVRWILLRVGVGSLGCVWLGLGVGVACGIVGVSGWGVLVYWHSACIRSAAGWVLCVGGVPWFGGELGGRGFVGRVASLRVFACWGVEVFCVNEIRSRNLTARVVCLARSRKT